MATLQVMRTKLSSDSSFKNLSWDYTDASFLGILLNLLMTKRLSMEKSCDFMYNYPKTYKLQLHKLQIIQLQKCRYWVVTGVRSQELLPGLPHGCRAQGLGPCKNAQQPYVANSVFIRHSRCISIVTEFYQSICAQRGECLVDEDCVAIQVPLVPITFIHCLVPCWRACALLSIGKAQMIWRQK